jgi:endonuclease-3 related protein
MQLAGQPPVTAPGATLQQYYSTLLRQFGPQGWWPARTRLEIILGAILTQNTTWHNTARALKRLREARRLTWPGLRRASVAELEECVRPAGFYRQKARAIRSFVRWLVRAHRGSLAVLFSRPVAKLRQQLLNLPGLGPETVDAIVLYAGRQPFFVADAYTRRILSRHGLLSPTASYAVAQQFLHRHLPADAALFSEFHALLVEVGKKHCKRQVPQCDACPLHAFLPHEAKPGVGVRGSARRKDDLPRLGVGLPRRSQAALAAQSQGQPRLEHLTA